MPESVTKVAVVGGGIAGLSLAWELARAGAGVTVYEAGKLGAQGASALPAALLNPYRGRSARASQLDRAGLAAIWRLHRELARLGLDSGAERSGLLRIPSKSRQARDWRALAARDDALAWLETDAVPVPLHAPFGALHVRQGGWVDAATLLRALAAAARGAGARIAEGSAVRALTPHTDGVRISGERLEADFDLAVLCIGASAAPAGVTLPPLERVEGDIVRLGSDALPYPIAGAVYGVSTGQRTLIGGNHRPAGRADPQAPAALRRSAAWFAPPLAEAAIEGVWSGVRARQPGNRPLLTRLDDRVWLFGALAGRGFLCTPTLAPKLARALLQGGDRTDTPS